VRELSRLVDVILVVGAIHSSNSNRLNEIGPNPELPAIRLRPAGNLNQTG
jgi:4-hydroxy-3-methylbut-2-enyl diphosphate reductase IspH